MQAMRSAACSGRASAIAPRPAARAPALAARRAGRSTVRRVAAQGAEYDALKGQMVVNVATGEFVELLSLWQPQQGKVVAVPFMTHFADLSSWEFAQKLVKALPALDAAGVTLIAVGLGSEANARSFANNLNFPLERLFADPSGACYKALGFSEGFGAGLDVNPYVKLLPMLAGIGSPGTVEEVLRGYIGDQGAKPVFESDGPMAPLGQAFDILGKGYQRPFELATLRLFNMTSVLTKWAELSPPNANLLTQQGGALVFDGEDAIFKHVDTGILKYANVDALVAVACAQTAVYQQATAEAS